MGCCGGSADWKREEVLDHKFDFIDVRDYRDNGMMAQLKYTLLYANMAKSVAVYLADIYTAITLIVMGHLSGPLYSEVATEHSPLSVSVEYTRWIFTGCIIFSFLLLAYEAHKARAIVRSRDISYAYTNVMANNWYSLNSYDHFCFFQQINDSKKRKDEFAFFIFFTFKGWKRLLVADGPRQVINAFVLFSVAASNDFTSDVYQYYKGNILTGVLLLTMIFTVVVFAASAFLLAVAALMYIPLIMYIKGNLKEYCCHKIDKRISELVRRKKKSRMARQVARAKKEAEGDYSHLMNKKGEMVGRAIPQPTLPNVEVDLYSDSGSTLNGPGALGGGGPGPGYAGSIAGTDKGFGGGGPGGMAMAHDASYNDAFSSSSNSNGKHGGQQYAKDDYAYGHHGQQLADNMTPTGLEYQHQVPGQGVGAYAVGYGQQEHGQMLDDGYGGRGTPVPMLGGGGGGGGGVHDVLHHYHESGMGLGPGGGVDGNGGYILDQDQGQQAYYGQNQGHEHQVQQQQQQQHQHLDYYAQDGYAQDGGQPGQGQTPAYAYYQHGHQDSVYSTPGGGSVAGQQPQQPQQYAHHPPY
ncbi:Potassium transporter [Tilletia horrida]|uniref:Potassium transporter n=1 Tax=Tilletia horrida TaxID=155126 RepID=A0AAN6G462_9BASI|nr:Potassium transporter [Tilletia horrida]KAK0546976.1 Potassium transporter [Tilletia horrida]